MPMRLGLVYRSHARMGSSIRSSSDSISANSFSASLSEELELSSSLSGSALATMSALTGCSTSTSLVSSPGKTPAASSTSALSATWCALVALVAIVPACCFLVQAARCCLIGVCRLDGLPPCLFRPLVFVRFVRTITESYQQTARLLHFCSSAWEVTHWLKWAARRKTTNAHCCGPLSCALSHRKRRYSPPSFLGKRRRIAFTTNHHLHSRP
mmetsp:Transcript_18572/g.32924  ORF Transcript_18572/g.32924 Transcript_18572/m.32924 type:complete len:212 (-) Transcript_18572:520-1155(-)